MPNVQQTLFDTNLNQDIIDALERELVRLTANGVDVSHSKSKVLRDIVKERRVDMNFLAREYLIKQILGW